MKTVYEEDNEIRNLLMGIKDSIIKIEENNGEAPLKHKEWLIQNMRLFLKLVKADGENYPQYIGKDVPGR